MIQIDLNCDVGEGRCDESAILPYLSSCNIACGGHAGDSQTMVEVLTLAKKYNVKVGAHPSYPDKKNFGREAIAMPLESLKESITSQILSLKAIASELGIALHHIKPHGALYNKAAYDKDTANSILSSILQIDKSLVIYAPYNSVIAHLAKGKIKVSIEGFADRMYNSDYSLVSRNIEGSVITNSNQVLKHVLPMLLEHKLYTMQGDQLPFKIHTLCVHGDTKNSMSILQNLRREFNKKGIKII